MPKKFYHPGAKLVNAPKMADKIADSLYSDGWRKATDEVGLKTVFYAVRGRGNECEALRVEHFSDGSIQILCLPKNMKEIAVENIRRYLTAED